MPKPENIEIYFVAFEQVVVGEALESFAFFAFMTILSMKTLDELVHIRAF